VRDLEVRVHRALYPGGDEAAQWNRHDRLGARNQLQFPRTDHDVALCGVRAHAVNQLYESDQTTGSVRTPTPGRLGREGRGCGRAAGTAPTGDGTAAAWGAGCTGAGFGAGALYGIGRIFCVLSGSSSTGEPIARINCWKPVL